MNENHQFDNNTNNQEQLNEIFFSESDVNNSVSIYPKNEINKQLS